jgi:NDP-sugar pyrophosphorylase family protein
MAPLFAAIFGDGDRFGLRIDHCIEETPRGTAGALKQLQAVEDDFIVVNGDLLTTLDFQQLFAEHRRHRNAWATIALHDRVVNIDYGVVETTSTGVLKRYVEKPTMVYAVSMGANVLSSRCLGLITTDYLDMPQLLSAVHDAGHLVVCYKPECYWQDMGRLDDYEQASADFAASPERFLPRSSAT